MLCLRNTVLSVLLLAVGIVSVYSGSVNVDDGRYTASWTVQGNNITIEVTAQGVGYVGFGISPGNGMEGADIFIGGVDANKTAYSFDTHATGHAVPIVDDVNNYELLSASETETTTTIRFRRALNTQDSQDLTITNSNQTIIWAIGGSDDLEWHFTNRGVLQLNLLAQ